MSVQGKALDFRIDESAIEFCYESDLSYNYMILVDLVSDPFFDKLITRFLYRVFKDYGSVYELWKDGNLSRLDALLGSFDTFDHKMSFDDIHDVLVEFFSRQTIGRLRDVLNDHDQDGFNDDQRAFFWDIQAIVYERITRDYDRFKDETYTPVKKAASVKKADKQIKTYIEVDLFGRATSETVIIDCGLQRTTVKIKPGEIAGSQLSLL